ncbi:MAG: Zn-ribbon containing protein [Halobacteria archaeon]|nr:Zn-ribbon containing protein [Halobacteria archaeon]
MPHKCTNCGEIFEDGTDEVLDGCPVCGGGKFRYVGDLSVSTNDTDDDEIIEASQSDSSVSEQSESEADSSSYYSGDWPDHHGADEEVSGSRSQTSESEEDKTEVTEEERERIRQEKLRQELMEQFESIRIIEPGSYKINLMNLYDNDERVITLQEDGRYQISIPSTDD